MIVILVFKPKSLKCDNENAKCNIKVNNLAFKANILNLKRSKD